MKSRIVTIEQIYHQAAGDPTVFETRNSRFLETDEQPFVRNLPRAEHWRQLETGWVAGASVTVLRNDGDDTLEVQFCERDLCFIPPKESMRLPHVQNFAFLRVRGGPYTIARFPS